VVSGSVGKGVGAVGNGISNAGKKIGKFLSW